MVEIKAVHVVHATWCPHCHPTTVEPMQKISEELGIPFFSYDIDVPEQEKKADELVRRFGDWSEDYLVPQVFLEMNNGEIRHVLTGYPRGVDLTRRAVINLLNKPLFAKASRRVKQPARARATSSGHCGQECAQRVSRHSTERRFS